MAIAKLILKPSKSKRVVIAGITEKLNTGSAPIVRVPTLMTIPIETSKKILRVLTG